MSEQQLSMTELLREASEQLSEASDRLTAAALLEQGRREKLHAQGAPRRPLSQQKSP